MSNSTAILAELNTPAFDVVRDEIRANLLDFAKRSLARYQLDVAAWVASEKLPVHCRSTIDYKTFPKCRINGCWISNKVDCSDHGCIGDDYYRKLQNAVIAWTINEANVQEDADGQWADSKAFYAARVGEKADLIGGDGSVKLNVTLNRELTGHCVVVLGKKALVLETSLKTNYRYGENSANGDLTIYRQVPTVIVSSNGFDAHAAQVDVEQAKLQAKLDKKSALIALAEKLRTLEKRKRHADDLAHTLDYVAKYNNGVATGGNVNSIIEEVAALGLTVTPSVKESKLIVKELREAIKSVKAEIKAVKTTK